jgi:hypothetical protein
MVFEKIVVDLLNKYLGEYVENLDRSQLKLGIWGGERFFYLLHNFHPLGSTGISIVLYVIKLLEKVRL